MRAALTVMQETLCGVVRALMMTPMSSQRAAIDGLNS
jgi:hypothetical protein